QLLAADVLHLQPGAAPPPGQVAAVESLGDQALQAALLREAQERRSLAQVVAGRLPARPVELDLLELLATLGVGKVDEGATVKVEQVEDQVGDRAVGHPAPHGGLRGEVHASL